MKIDQLRTFQKVALTGSFTKAARELFLTQPAVSQQVKALEHTYGVRLFDRKGKTIQMTHEGEILFSKINNLLSELRDIEKLFEDMSELDIGKIDIASTAVFSTYFLPRAMGGFNKNFPGIELELHTDNSHRVITRLLEGGTDFGFGGVVKSEPDIKFSLIHQEPYIFVVGSEHPLAEQPRVSVNDLKDFPFIWREHGTLTRRKMEEMLGGSQAAFIFKNVIEVQNVETAKRFVEGGYGVTIIPEIAVRRELDSGWLREVGLEGLDLKASYYLLYPRKRPLSRYATAFLRLLPETVTLTNATGFLDTIGR
jgi:DNA-binding transcriptional LysR family regulator